MQKIKIFILLLLLFSSISSYAVAINPINADNPYLPIGGDKLTTIFIGAYKNYLPIKLENGDVVIRAMMQQDVADFDHPKGQQHEYVVLGNCEERLAKILVIWQKPKEGELGVARYDLKGQELMDKIVEEVNKEKSRDIETSLILSLVVSSGCNYVGEKIVYPPAEKPKPREWTA